MANTHDPLVPEPDWPLIDRYLAGQAAPEDEAAARAALQADPGMAALARELPDALAQAEPAWPVDAAWRRLARRVAPAAPGSVDILPLRPRRRVWPALAAAAALAAALTGILLAWRAGAFDGGERALAELRTGAGQRDSLRLADGTLVRLDAGSRLRYPAPGGAGAARELYLDGQAYFVVTHDGAHPFVLHAGGAVVRDLGTEFGVTAYPGASAVRVVLVRGSVSVASGASSPRTLAPGQLARVDSLGRIDVRAAVPAAWLGWTRGVLAFEDRPLGDVLPELGRWYGVEIRVADAALAARPLTAEFRQESLDQALDAIAAALGARWQRTAYGIALEPRSAR